MKILVATSNPHKLDEIRSVFEAEASELQSVSSNNNYQCEFVSLREINLNLDEPVEDQPTFEGNAELKARYYANSANMCCIADDSGLEVDALDGAPGVISARFAGMKGPRDVIDPANNKKLLDKLGDTPSEQRTARFVCAMCYVDPESREDIEVRGTIEGRILLPEEATDPTHPERGRGHNGFGYDPLFYLHHLEKTSAELSPEHKNRISHRGDASRKMFAALQERFGSASK